jgi:hypothetical protein
MAAAPILGEVGLVHLLGAREKSWVGTRFAILGFSHRLSLMLTRRAAHSVCLALPAGLGHNPASRARFRREASRHKRGTSLLEAAGFISAITRKCDHV